MSDTGDEQDFSNLALDIVKVRLIVTRTRKMLSLVFSKQENSNYNRIKNVVSRTPRQYSYTSTVSITERTTSTQSDANERHKICRKLETDEHGPFGNIIGAFTMLFKALS